MRADYLRSGFSGLLPYSSGDVQHAPAAAALDLCSLPWRSRLASRCRSMIRQLSSLRRLWRAMLLVIVATFAVRLTLAEIYYARGMNRSTEIGAAMDDLMRARNLYPFDRRFADGPAVRFAAFKESGH